MTKKLYDLNDVDRDLPLSYSQATITHVNIVILHFFHSRFQKLKRLEQKKYHINLYLMHFNEIERKTPKKGDGIEHWNNRGDNLEAN
jgi:hypothetical protein